MVKNGQKWKKLKQLKIKQKLKKVPAKSLNDLKSPPPKVPSLGDLPDEAPAFASPASIHQQSNIPNPSSSLPTNPPHS